MNSLLKDFKMYEQCRLNSNSRSLLFDDYDNINPTTLLLCILDCYTDEDFDDNLKFEIKNYLKEYSSEKQICFEKIDSSYNFQKSTIEYRFSKFINTINDKKTFYYFFAEILSNIDDHSNFNNAYVLAKKYEDNMIDLCFLDDGVSLPYTLNQMKEDNLTIYDATKGVSSKKEEGRGYGLPSTIKIITKSLNGEILIASRNAVYYKSEKNELSNNLECNVITGTLICLRFTSTILPSLYSII